MCEYALLYWTRLTGNHEPTGHTKHYLGDKELPPPVELRIVHYPGDNGCYLLYCDGNGVEITDTYHVTVNDALEQAKFEFGVEKSEWCSVPVKKDELTEDGQDERENGRSEGENGKKK